MFWSQHLGCWGQNTSRIQNKGVYATLCLQACHNSCGKVTCQGTDQYPEGFACKACGNAVCHDGQVRAGECTAATKQYECSVPAPLPTPLPVTKATTTSASVAGTFKCSNPHLCTHMKQPGCVGGICCGVEHNSWVWDSSGLATCKQAAGYLNLKYGTGFQCISSFWLKCSRKHGAEATLLNTLLGTDKFECGENAALYLRGCDTSTMNSLNAVAGTTTTTTTTTVSTTVATAVVVNDDGCWQARMTCDHSGLAEDTAAQFDGCRQDSPAAVRQAEADCRAIVTSMNGCAASQGSTRAGVSQPTTSSVPTYASRQPTNTAAVVKAAIPGVRRLAANDSRTSSAAPLFARNGSTVASDDDAGNPKSARIAPVVIGVALVGAAAAAAGFAAWHRRKKKTRQHVAVGRHMRAMSVRTNPAFDRDSANATTGTVDYTTEVPDPLSPIPAIHSDGDGYLSVYSNPCEETSLGASEDYVADSSIHVNEGSVAYMIPLTAASDCATAGGYGAPLTTAPDGATYTAPLEGNGIRSQPAGTGTYGTMPLTTADHRVPPDGYGAPLTTAPLDGAAYSVPLQADGVYSEPASTSVDGVYSLTLDPKEQGVADGIVAHSTQTDA